MAETLLAILLVTSSAKGSNLIYRWPPSPTSSPRLNRARAPEPLHPYDLDNPWRASNFSDGTPEVNIHTPTPTRPMENDSLYQKADTARDRSASFSRPTSRSASGRNSPVTNRSYHHETPPVDDGYTHVFGYSTEFLASLLCPQRLMCHQKFELLVDDLAFIGHPVCAEPGGGWQFRPEKTRPGFRGRESRNSHSDERSLSGSSPIEQPSTKSSWLHTFHFVMVLDLPDPSSSASGNVAKYFDIIYEQIAFTVAAVLYHEQTLFNFVEEECDALGTLENSCLSRGEPFINFMTQALEGSSIAPAMKLLYEAIKSSSMAYITLNNIPMELQLPPFLDTLLRNEEENQGDFANHSDDEELQMWGEEMQVGWRLPMLAPWKSLLLLDNDNGLDPYMNLRGPHVNPDDRALAEGLIRFLETATVTLSLADIGSLLDWDIDTHVFPAVRWLVHHRRAKVVDLVHPGLKTVFTLPAKFEQPISELVSEFENEFSHPSIPPLPKILATISASIAKQRENHFFASVVQSKELIPMYHDVVLWMLKRDMLITLHLRIRIVATQELKVRVRLARERALSRRTGGRGRSGRSGLRQELEFDEMSGSEMSSQGPSGIAWLSLSPRSAHRYSRRMSSTESARSLISELIIPETDEEGETDEEPKGEESTSDIEDDGWDTPEDHLRPSMITDPGMATPLQRRWLTAMSEGKEDHIARRLNTTRINQYFDGKKTDDEILFRAEITRKQLREVLHHYEEYLQTFLHPS
ncbi:nitrogen permease regulator of amino acid transport activity 3-domain-containing protein [Infundibulicybe gibba]|nr:nitrogen permease regulator of amino acid transport activity 3-domain-containing protein [Infundibulicybe gibba]